MSRPIRGMMWRRTNGRENMMFELFRVYTTNARATTVPLVFAILKWRRSVGPFHFFFRSILFSPPLLLSTGRRSNDDTNIFYWWLWRNLFYFQNRVTLQRVARNGRKKRKTDYFLMLTRRIERENRWRTVVAGRFAFSRLNQRWRRRHNSADVSSFFLLFLSLSCWFCCPYVFMRMGGRTGWRDGPASTSSVVISLNLFVHNFFSSLKRKRKQKSLFLPKMGISLIVFLLLSWWVRQSLAESQTGRVLKKV